MQVREFQDTMRRVYFHRDSERGEAGTFRRLAEEVDELRDALLNDDVKALCDEFADVLAWLASLANVAGVDLESATLSKYDSKCPKCSRSPCNCQG